MIKLQAWFHANDVLSYKLGLLLSLGFGCPGCLQGLNNLKIPEVLSADMVVLKSRSYNAFVGGKSVRLVEDNTNGVLLAADTAIYLPVSFLESLGYSCNGETTYNHYGMQYVKANGIIEGAGKHITVTGEGLVIIADAAVTDTDTLTILYRSLS